MFGCRGQRRAAIEWLEAEGFEGKQGGCEKREEQANVAESICRRGKGVTIGKHGGSCKEGGTKDSSGGLRSHKEQDGRKEMLCEPWYSVLVQEVGAREVGPEQMVDGEGPGLQAEHT